MEADLRGMTGKNVRRLSAVVGITAVSVCGMTAAWAVTHRHQVAARQDAVRQDADMQRQLVAAERTLTAVVAPTGLTRVAATTGCTTTLRRICLVSHQDPATVSAQVGTWLGGTPVQYSSSQLRHSINGHLGGTRLIGVVIPRRDAKRVVVGSAILLYVPNPG
jgi:hypothetical protein